MANGSISLVRTRRIPLVPSLAAAISDVGFDTADCALDCEYFPDIYNVALPRTWASVGIASCLGHAAGIWMPGNGRCNSCFAPDHTIGDVTTPNEPSRVKPTSRDVFLYPGTFVRHPSDIYFID